MGTKNTKNNKKHTKIRGSLKCFKNTILEEKAIELKHGPLFEDGLIDLRNLAKEAFALRVKLSAKAAKCYSPISQDSLNILLTYLKSLSATPDAYKFADCFFAAFNNNNNLVTLNPPKYSSNKKHKALKCALKDCTKAFNSYFKPILLRIEKTDAELLDNQLVGKYKDIKVALVFSICYIYDLNCKKMPAKLSCNSYTCAAKLDSKVSHHYVYSDVLKCYVLDRSKSNNCYSTVSQECATYLICYKHKQ